MCILSDGIRKKKIIKPLQNNAQTTTCVYITSTKIHRSSKFSMISARDIIKEKRRMGKGLERGDGLLKQVLFWCPKFAHLATHYQSNNIIYSWKSCISNIMLWRKRRIY